MVLELMLGLAVVAPLLCYCVYTIYVCMRADRLMKNSGYFHLTDIPVLGTVSIFSRLTSSEGLSELLEEYLCVEGVKGCMLKVGHFIIIGVTELEDIEEIIQSVDLVDKSFVYRLISDFSTGVVTTSGDIWRKLRKSINPTFSQKMFDLYMDDINGRVECALGILRKKENDFFDVRFFLQYFLFDVVARTHFNMETNEQKQPLCQFTERISKSIRLIFEKRIFIPYLHPNFMFKLTSAYKEIIDTCTPIWKYMPKVMEEGMAKYISESTSANEEYGTRKINYPLKVKAALEELGMEPSTWNIMIHSYDALFAGTETTSISLCTFLYRLALNPEEQERLYLEAVEVYGGKEFRPLVRNDVARLVRTEMAFKDAIRLCSPPGTARSLNRDFPLGSHVLPKGALIYCSLKAVHRNPKYWERPNDFYPDHFLPENVEKRPKRAFLGFSQGPRNCPGGTFAYLMGKMLVSAIIRKYRIETNLPLDQVKYKTVLMEDHVNGYPIKFIPR